MKIDTKYCFNNDVSNNNVDPDAYNEKLANHHKILWSKKTPSQYVFDLQIKASPKFQLVYVLDGETKVLTSDCIANSHIENASSELITKYRNKMRIENPGVEEEYEYLGRTIGGHIVLPGICEPGQKMTINQKRGFCLADRIDITLECIKRYYEGNNENNPLFDLIKASKYFFDLFIDFKGFIDFFLMQDYVDNNYNVNFLLPFDGHIPNRINSNISYEDCKLLTIKTIELCKKRNSRIFDYCIEHSIPVE